MNTKQATNSASVIASDPVERAVERFEAALGDSGNLLLDLADFLPDASESWFWDAAVELIRVDMEHRWSHGQPRRLRDYLDRFEAILTDRQRLAELAFEEYRCRLQAGELVTPEEYETAFALDTNHWPRQTHVESDGQQAGSWLTEPEQMRLLSAIEWLPDVGDCFLGFELVECIGRGAFGTVFLARQTNLASRSVVLKVTAGGTLEADRLARLQHTNIVPIHSVHADDHLVVVCMPFLGRHTLADLLAALRSAGPIPETTKTLPQPFDSLTKPTGTTGYVDFCLRLAHGLADGLAHAHERGILHRDIKPANVLLSDEGEPLLLDFGVADSLADAPSSGALVGGTLPYMSPEQRDALRTGQRVDARSDIFAFGMLLQEMLTLTSPSIPGDGVFGATTRTSDPFPIAKLDTTPWAGQATARMTAEAIRRQNPLVPRSIANLVAQCTEPDLARRYQTMAQVTEDLRRHADHLPLRYASDRAVRERWGKFRRRHPRLMSTSAVVGVSAVILSLALGALIVANDRLDRLAGRAVWQDVQQLLPQMRIAVTARDLDDEQLVTQVEKANALLERSVQWAGSPTKVGERFQQAIGDETAAEPLAELAFLLTQARQRAGQPAATRSAAWQQMVITLPTTAGSRNDNHNSNFLTAIQRIQQGDFVAALPLVEQLQQSHPQDHSAWFLLGNVYAGVGRLSEAESCYSACIALSPESYTGYFQRGLCRFDQRDFQAAADDFTRAAHLRPRFAAAIFNRALCFRRLNALDRALDDLAKVEQWEGPRVRPLLVRSRILRIQGKPLEADRLRRQAIRLPATDVDDLLARGLARAKEDPAAAEHDFRAAHRLRPDLPAAQRNLAYLLAERGGKTDEGLAVLERLINRFDRTEDRMARAVLLARLGRMDEAQKEGQAALERDGSPKMQFQMACVYALSPESQRQAEAIAPLAKAIAAEAIWLDVALRDRDLQALHGREDFRRLLAAAKQVQRAANGEAGP